MTTTPNTTASGAADLMRNALRETAAVLVLEDAFPDLLQMVESALAASAPVAPAPQPAPMPYPTDAQVDAVYEQTMGQHLRSQDAPAVRRFGRAMFLCAWNAAAPKADHIADASKMVPAPLQQGEYLPLPVPAFKLFWDGGQSCYKVTKPKIDNADVFTVEQIHAYVDADRAARGAAQAAPANGDTASPFQARVPLSAPQIAAMYLEAMGQQHMFSMVEGAVTRFTRALEKHHGITPQEENICAPTPSL